MVDKFLDFPLCLLYSFLFLIFVLKDLLFCLGASPVGVRIRDAILVFNVLWVEGHLEPHWHFAF